MIESRPRQATSRGSKLWFRYDSQEFEVEWYDRESSDSCETFIRPITKLYHDAHGDEPDWWPNPWPRFAGILELEAITQLFDMLKSNFDRAYKRGRADRAREIRHALGIQ